MRWPWQKKEPKLLPEPEDPWGTLAAEMAAQVDGVWWVVELDDPLAEPDDDPPLLFGPYELLEAMTVLDASLEKLNSTPEGQQTAFEGRVRPVLGNFKEGTP